MSVICFMVRRTLYFQTPWSIMNELNESEKSWKQFIYFLSSGVCNSPQSIFRSALCGCCSGSSFKVLLPCSVHLKGKLWDLTVWTDTGFCLGGAVVGVVASQLGGSLLLVSLLFLRVGVPLVPSVKDWWPAQGCHSPVSWDWLQPPPPPPLWPSK